MTATALSSSTSWPPSLGPGNPSRYLDGIHARVAELFEAEGNAGAAYEHMKKAVSVPQDPAARPTP